MTDLAVRVWNVGALCRALADALDARFNPVAVLGEVSGFSRAASGHCYFSLKDEAGQLRCVMFKRASGTLLFTPRDGDMVELRGRLAVYEPRGDLQLIVESMRQAGAGAWYERFLQLKVALQAEGLFDAARKRPVDPLPRGIGVVTSLAGAALHDVVSALGRRVPHVHVVVAPALVQGQGSAGELSRGLEALYRLAGPDAPVNVRLDTILLVRGGGSMEDLWAFNDEALARTISRSPIPVVSGVGHETDFTIADMVADLRAPTPTAAAEMAAQPRQDLLDLARATQERLDNCVLRTLDAQAQRLDRVAARLGRPSVLAAAQRQGVVALSRRLRTGVSFGLRQRQQLLQGLALQLPRQLGLGLTARREELAGLAMRLQLLDPALVLQRGYAWLTDESGMTIADAALVAPGQNLRARLARGVLDLTVRPQG